jgi:hypothetical protein
MELNDNRDPILMEKLFGSPEAMFKSQLVFKLAL